MLSANLMYSSSFLFIFKKNLGNRPNDALTNGFLDDDDMCISKDIFHRMR